MVCGHEKSDKHDSSFLTALVADAAGEIFELEGYAAVGMAGDTLVPLLWDDTLKMPFGSELMLMPARNPILYNIGVRRFEVLAENPHAPGESVYPVAAFNSPGYLLAYVSAYREGDDAEYLPLFSYGAVGWHGGKFRTAVMLVDREKRQDLRGMHPKDVLAGVKRIKKKMPNNRLRRHLEKCALEYGCPAAKNFFLARYEAPLPTSPYCNARCLGCLSLQVDRQIPRSQDRIAFVPSAEEIAEVAVEHITRVKRSVVSFGQGCEGDPLLAAGTIDAAVRIIRSQTREGTVNMNTNGSRPEILKKLFDAGLDSVRISLNSVRSKCYNAYFRPRGYDFSDVMKSIDIALDRERFVSINYLNMPGFTDTPKEVDALFAFLRQRPIDMIQWRNLNYDPFRYWCSMAKVAAPDPPVGMRRLLKMVQSSFPGLRHGYFNPAKEDFII